MVDINLILSVLLYLAGIILLIVLTILGIKLIYLVDKADRVLDNVEGKVNSFNALFETIDKISLGLTTISENVVSAVTSTISRVFSKKNKKESEEIIDE